KPKGANSQSYLFYLPWANHVFNGAFNLQDAGGPLLRGMVLVTCTGSELAYGVTENEFAPKPFLQTLLQMVNLPRNYEIPVPVGKKSKAGTCENVENPNPPKR